MGLTALLKAFGIDLPSSSLQLLPRTIWVSLAIGTLVTLVAAISPARRAASIPPIAAMRDIPPPAASLGRRSVVGGAVAVVGVASLLYGLFSPVTQPIRFVGLGVTLIFVGVAMLAPLVARPLSRAIGAPFARLFKLPGRLGRENASRNPRRTASTASALMIGLALVGFTSVFTASLKASVGDVLASTLRADYIMSTEGFTGFSPAAAEAVRQRVVRTVNQAKVKLADTSTRVRGATTDAAKATDRYVHDNPWKSIAYGAAAGAVVAVLAAALLRDDE